MTSELLDAARSDAEQPAGTVVPMSKKRTVGAFDVEHVRMESQVTAPRTKHGSSTKLSLNFIRYFLFLFTAQSSSEVASRAGNEVFSCLIPVRQGMSHSM